MSNASNQNKTLLVNNLFLLFFPIEIEGISVFNFNVKLKTLIFRSFLIIFPLEDQLSSQQWARGRGGLKTVQVFVRVLVDISKLHVFY